MKRHYSIFLLVLVTVVLFGACGCERPIDDPVVPPQKDTTVVEPADMIWSGKPYFNVPVENTEATEERLPIRVRITTDTKQLVYELDDTVTVAGQMKKEFAMTTPENMDPGFYRAICFVNGKNVRSFNFGIDPFEIVSAPDYQPDFTQFWEDAKAQLAGVSMDAVLTEITERSSATRKVYLVEMNSVPDGLTGEPVKIRGYYCEPTDGDKHPVIMHFYGYDTQGSKSKCECPNGGSSSYAEFYLSHRGQYLNNRPANTNLGVTEATENIYGDWFSYNLGETDSY